VLGDGLRRRLLARRRQRRPLAAEDRARADSAPARLENPVIAPTVRRGLANAPVEAQEDERSGVVVLPLGPLDAEERVTLVFALHAPSRDAVVGWDRVLVGVEPTAGAGRPGDAGELTMGRVVHAAGRAVIQLTDVARKAIAKGSEQHPSRSRRSTRTALIASPGLGT
jgi:hypothetical protein